MTIEIELEGGYLFLDEPHPASGYDCNVCGSRATTMSGEAKWTAWVYCHACSAVSSHNRHSDLPRQITSQERA